jgi:tetratricopeptide (TPR) repeat protein
MHNSKIEQLLEFLKEEPNDSFTLYALALEYEKSDTAKALAYYDLLLKEHPEYLATYYHAGKLVEKSDKETSKKIYTNGMALATKQGKTKTYNELQNALNLLLDEEYD